MRAAKFCIVRCDRRRYADQNCATQRFLNDEDVNVAAVAGCAQQPKVVPARPEFEDTEHQKDVDLALSAVTGVDSSIKVVPPREEFVGKSIEAKAREATEKMPTLLEPELDEGLQPRKSKGSEQHHFQVEMD